MGDPRHDLGLAAERAVAAWLSAAGWTVLHRRLRSEHGGEVDLVARDPYDVLVAIEVRARRSDRAGAAAWSVDRRRIGRLRRTLAGIGRRHGWHAGMRVDLVTVEPMAGTGGRWRLRRIPGIDDG
jgi:putative endonuclease